jgi:hypothetical protein
MPNLSHRTEATLLAAPSPLVKTIREQVLISVEKLGPCELEDVAWDVQQVWKNCREPEPDDSQIYTAVKSMVVEGLLRMVSNNRQYGSRYWVALPKRKPVKVEPIGQKSVSGIGRIAMTHTGERNPFWKGGRTVTPDGYVLVRVGVDHHLSDVRGYAYEHRIVAETMLGRRLLENEEVHHDDENRQNNSPGNLIICGCHAEHMIHHRKPGCNRRLPGEANTLVECACGCGSMFMQFDDSGRPRMFVSGHNRQPSPTIDAVLLAMSEDPKQIRQIAADSGVPLSEVKTKLSRLKRRGIVACVSHGFWKKEVIDNG